MQKISLLGSFLPFAAVESVVCCRTPASSYADIKLRIRSDGLLPANAAFRCAGTLAKAAICRKNPKVCFVPQSRHLGRM